MADRPARAPYAIATPHAAATEAGRRAFEDGGNAVDAALAAATVLTVVYPHMCALGGDVMALVHDGDAHAVNGSGRSAAALPASGAAVPERGPRSITVPGAVAAWQVMAERWGSRPLAAAMLGAAALAAEGVPVAPSLARSLLAEAGLVAADEGLRGAFAPAGPVLRRNELLVQPALARTLERLAARGSQDFYAGETAALLLAGLAARGCPLTAADLAAHETGVEAALGYALAAEEILTTGPNSQGFSLAQILATIDVLGLDDPMGEQAPILASVFRESAGDRDRYLADPAAMECAVGDLLSAEHVAELADRATARAGDAGALRAPAGHGDTVAVVTAGPGLAVSLIQSVFYAFGAGILEPRTGIICHNRGACFSADPRSPNAIAPAKRPLHTLMPLVVAQAGRPTWIAGTMGGHAQPQIHAQILLRRHAGAGAADAVAAPRLTVGDLDSGGTDVCIEADATRARDALSRVGIEPVLVPRLSEAMGHAQAVAVRPDGTFEAASDPRADGAAAW